MDRFEELAAGKLGAQSDLDLGAFAASFDLFRLATLYFNRLESQVHRPAGISTAGFRVLFTVWVYGELEPRQIAKLSGVTTAAVSGVVNTLAGKGMVCKERDGDDKRLVKVTLTTAGAELVTAVYAKQNKHERDMFAALTPQELQAFTSTIRKLL